MICCILGRRRTVLPSTITPMKIIDISLLHDYCVYFSSAYDYEPLDALSDRTVWPGSQCTAYIIGEVINWLLTSSHPRSSEASLTGDTEMENISLADGDADGCRSPECLPRSSSRFTTPSTPSPVTVNASPKPRRQEPTQATIAWLEPYMGG